MLLEDGERDRLHLGRREVTRRVGLWLALTAASFLLAPVAAAQQVSPLNPPATSADLQALQSLIPIPADTPPPTEMPGGTAGSTMTFRRGDSANNRISRSAQFTVGANGAILCGGSATCSWATPLPAGAASYPIFFTAIGATGAPGVKCKVTSTTNTGFTGAVCVQSVASISILGASVEVVAASGTQIFALSLPATQASQ